MLKTVCTCSACPEQYDIYEDKKLVAYVRLRWGHLTVSPYEGDHISDIIIYEKTYSDKFKGCFDDEEERQETMDFILMLVNDYLTLAKLKEKLS